MANEEKEKIPFDPGYSKFIFGFPKDAHMYIEEIASYKQNHQKKFAFANLENQIVPVVKHCASFYLGCMLWGAYVFWKYRDDAREMDGNYVLSLSEEEREKFHYNDELDYILNFLDKFEKAAKHYQKRASRVSPEFVGYFEAYKKFVELNDDFKNLRFTNEIKLPEEFSHFEHHSGQKLDELKQKIYDIIASEKIEEILQLGYYK